MATIQIQIEMNRGVRGVPLEKLAKVVGDIQQFFAMLSEDVGLEEKTESWVGLDFADGSLTFTAEKAEPVTVTELESFNSAFTSIVDKRPVATLRRATIAQYAKIAEPIDATEAVTFELFTPALDEIWEDSDLDSGAAEHTPSSAMVPLRRFDLTKSEAEVIRLEVQSTVR